MKNAFYAQSGGVTSVINSSAFGLFSELKEKAPEANIYVGKNGIVGLIEDEIYERTKIALAHKNLLLDAVLIRDVTLPSTLQDAIENKLKQEQISLEYDFKLVQAEKEAQKQIIEAQGKAEANKILNSSLTDNILRDKGIEATLKLSESPNSKVVVVGSSADGLPLSLIHI